VKREVELSFERGTLLLDCPDVALLPEEVPEGFLPDDRVGGKLRGPANLYRRALAKLIRAGFDVDDQARAYERLELGIRRRRDPFPHQRDALKAWDKARRRGVVVLPTGSGKSYVAEMAIAQVARSTLIVVPTIDLLNQWIWVLGSAFGRDRVGGVGGGLYDVKELTVTTYDSAYIHMPDFGDRFGFLVFDECHHLPGATYSQAALTSIAPYRLGLTATPERGDDDHAIYDALIGPIVYRRDIDELAGLYLAGYETVRLTVQLSEQERDVYTTAREIYLGFLRQHRIRMSASDGWSQFIRLANRSRAGRAAWSAWRESKQVALRCDAKLELLGELLGQHATEQCIVFTNDNETVYDISRRYLIPAITHQTKTGERQAILQGFNDGTLRAVVTSRVLNEGVDMPAASIGIILSGTASVREHVQRLGRILRRQEGKVATLYEVITEQTSEENISERRRDHRAYE
jgi:superfamily II DNA or RNA helicase